MTDLRIEQQQNLKLSVESRQGIALLSLTSLELGEYIRDCLESNPFLCEDETARRKQPLETGSAQHLSADNLSECAEKSRSFNTKLSGKREETQDCFERTITYTPTLIEYLSAQAGLVFNTQEEMTIAEYLIASVDAAGYLTCGCGEVALRCSASLERVEKTLTTLQKAVTPGLLARNLKDCLALQLRAHLELASEREIPDIAVRIVNEHLEDLATGKIAHIAACLDISPEKVQEAIDVVRSCNPKPGLSYAHTDVPVIWPEVIVESADTDGFRVRLCEFCLPKTCIDRTYLDLLAAEVVNAQTKQYLNQMYRSAVGLLCAIERRALTIKQVAVALVGRQYHFFKQGPGHLLPLTMAEIAEDVGISESTVSRVVNGTYLQTDFGLIEMRSLFSATLSSMEDKQSSQADALYHLQHLINEEDPHIPLSDAALSVLLSKELGVSVSRRTVNKYRNKIGIPSRNLRRRYD